MSISSLLAEFIFAGFQTLIWMVLLIYLFLGGEWIDSSFIKGIGIDELTMISVVSIPIVYPLGMLIDSVAQLVLSRWHGSIKNGIIGKQHGTSLRLILESDNDGLNDYLTSIRSTARIARSSILNFFLISLMLVVLTFTRLSSELDEYKFRFLFLVIFFGVLTVSISTMSWYISSKKYYQKLAIGLEFIKEKRS